MSRVRKIRGFIVVLLASACGHERIDLLAPPDEGDGGATGGAGTGGRATGGTGAPSGTGGRGHDGGSGPIPDCPTSQPNCLACEVGYGCPPELWCDVFRNYCAPYCSMQFACTRFDLPACDTSRNVCVECTFPGHCKLGYTCEFERCVPEPECFNNAQCDNPNEPVCFGGFCRACRSNAECEPGHCEYGRCEP
jgi:hypothetical protein